MILFYTLLLQSQLAVVNSVMNKCIFVPVIQRPNSKLQTRDSRIGPRPVNESLTVKTWQKTEPDDGVITRRRMVSEGASNLFEAAVPETLQINAIK